MNDDTTQAKPRKDPVAVAAAQQAIAAILASLGEQWAVAAGPGAVTVTRAWEDGSVDTLIITSVGATYSAYAYREDPRGIEVWTLEGVAEQVHAAVRDLPAPGQSGAPTRDDHSPGPSGVWT